MKKGLCLADLLIMLALMGVVMALTLPTITKNLHNHTLKPLQQYDYNFAIEHGD